MAKQTTQALSGEVVEQFTLVELCRSCAVHADWIVELVEEGILEPEGTDATSWRFSHRTIAKARTARRLQQDLDVNLAGIAIALTLMDEREGLRSQLQRMERALEHTVQVIDE